MLNSKCEFDLALAERFTRTYQQFRDFQKARREIACVRSQFPEVFLPIQENDLLAGRRYWSPVYFTAETRGLGGYYMDICRLDSYINDLSINADFKRRWVKVRNFWDGRTTCQRVQKTFSMQRPNAFPVSEPLIQDIPNYKKSAAFFPLYRLALTALDYGKLFELGLPGLNETVLRKRSLFASDPVSEDFLEAGVQFVEHIIEVCRHYEMQALETLKDTSDSRRRKNLSEIAQALQNLRARPPQTFHEALQLLWIYMIVSDSNNFGRMDIYIGDFLARDLDSGRITEERAIELLTSVYELINSHSSKFNGRIYIGGMGRPNPQTSDRFSLIAIETTRRQKRIIPQLSLRWHEGMNEEVFDKSLEAIAEGCTFPMLYNDDVNVPSVEHGFGIPRDMAEQYLGFGCGEYVIAHQSLSTPSGALSCLKVLDLTLRNGVDHLTGEEVGLKLGSPEDYPDYASLEEAYKKQIKHVTDILGEHQAHEYKVGGEQCAFVDRSLLYDECLERGRPLLAGGVKHLSGTVEVFGHINAYDSLYAIKKLVYEEKKFTLPELVEMLDNDFEGCEAERQMLLKLPKFGNDIEDVDRLARNLHSHLCECCREQRNRTALDSYLPVFINNEAYALWGRTTPASADGRRHGEPMANGGMPGTGNDRSGFTAVMHSIASLDPGVHAGTVYNFKLSKEFVTYDRSKFKSLIKGYFRIGGTQCMITVVSREELEDAKRHPERHKNLLVRVGGFSARFIELDSDVQEEIISRTLY